jgi:S1-C subfamily serine protease
MALRRITCPGCSKRIFVAFDVGSSTACPECCKLLEVSADGVRVGLAAVGEPSTREPSTHAGRDALPKQAKSDARKPIVGPRPPPMPEGARHFFAHGVLAVAVGIGIATIAALALIVILAVGGQGGRRSEVVAEAANLSAVESRGDSRSSAARLGATRSESGRRPAAAESGSRPGQPRTPAAGATNRPKATDPVRDALASVALVACRDGNGSGFMAAPRLLVTNHHVVANARVADLGVTFPDNAATGGKTFKTALVYEDPADDLAVLQVDCDVPPLAIPAAYQHTNGQRVVAIGSPGTGGGDALRNLTTDGRLGPTYRLPNGEERWALAMPVNPGNSGGPVIDAANGEVIGVVVAKFLRTESQGLAVPHERLLEAVRRSKAASTADRARAEALHRQRYCLVHMLRMIALADVSFQRSCAAAIEAEQTNPAGIREAFNEFKAHAAEVLTDEMVQFETVVCPEIDLVTGDADCEPTVRVGIGKLRATIEGQAEDLRRSVPMDQITDFVRGFRASMTRGRSLAETVAAALSLNPFEEVPE